MELRDIGNGFATVDFETAQKYLKWLEDKFLSLQARVKELESAPSPVLDLLGKFKEENSRMRKVVDAARMFMDCKDGAEDALEEAFRELDGGKKPSDTCECGHQKSAHIYEVGACRPGFKCEQHCDYFTAKR